MALSVGRSLKLSGIAFLSLWLVGCQGVQVKSKSNQLQNTLSAYQTTVRWGNLADMYQFLEPELALQAEIPSHLQNLRVTRYEEMGNPVVADDVATVTARISYVHQDRQVERVIQDRQQWRHEPGVGWLRSNPIPEMP
jgi:hypothetical protein